MMRVAAILFAFACSSLGATWFIAATAQRANSLPNDPLFSYGAGTNVVPSYDIAGVARYGEYEWAFNNTGQTTYAVTNGTGTNATTFSGTVDHGIVAAWGIQSQATNVLIAVIESSGIKIDHEDYSNVIWWTNLATGKAGAYINNTGVVGSVSSGGIINSQHAQTQIGILAMAGNNGKGGAGVLKDGSYIMPIQFDTVNEMDECLDFAISNRADIIMIGLSTSDPRWTNQLQKAYDSNILVICPFAETGRNSDTTGSFDHLRLDFPAAFQYWSHTNFIGGELIDGADVGVVNFPRTGPLWTNIISVGPMMRDGTFYTVGDYSTNFLTVAAGGHHIVSTHTNGGYTYVSGSSPATPIVTGEAALLIQQNPSWNKFRVRQRIIDTATRTPNMATNTLAGGYVNLYNALNPSYVAYMDTATDVLGPWVRYEGPQVVEATEPKRFFRVFHP